MIDCVSYKLTQIILIISVLSWLGVAKAESLFLTDAHSDFTAFQGANQSCSKSMTIVVRHPSPQAFIDKHVQLQQFLGGVRGKLDYQCPQQIEELLINGESAGNSFYRGKTSIATGWVLVDTLTPKEKVLVETPAQGGVDKEPIQQSVKKVVSQFNPDIWNNPWSEAGDKVKKLLKVASPIDGVAKLDNSIADSLRLPFYPGVSLIRVHSNWTPRNLYLYFLYDGQTITRLDGTSPPIHKFNANHQLLLNKDTAPSYLWFFYFFVRAEEGPFLVVNSPDDTFLPKDVKDTNNKGIEHLIRPARCQQMSGSNNYECSAIVYYSNAVLEVQFKIEPGGMVNMGSDKPVAADLSQRIDAPVSVCEVESTFSQDGTAINSARSPCGGAIADGEQTQPD